MNALRTSKERDYESPLSKVCSKCRLDKPLAAFAKRTAAKDGLQNWCRLCKSKKGLIPVPTEPEQDPQLAIQILQAEVTALKERNLTLTVINKSLTDAARAKSLPNKVHVQVGFPNAPTQIIVWDQKPFDKTAGLFQLLDELHSLGKVLERWEEDTEDDV